MFQLSNIFSHFVIISILIFEYQAKIGPHIITKIYVKTYKWECDLNPKYVDNVTCHLEAKSFTRALMNFKCDLKIPIRNISMNTALYKLYSEFRPHLINYTINLCDFLSGRASKLYAKMVYRFLKPVSNLNHSCPYQGTIFAKGIEMKDTYFPAGFIMPLGKFKTTLKFVEGYPPMDLGSVSVYAEVFEKRIKVDI